MLELRTFEGDAAEASWFVNRVWQSTYGKSAPLAVWNTRFLDWLFFKGGRAPRDYLVAAYDGGRLVGTLFAEPARLRLGDRDVEGTHGLRVTVDSAYRGEGVGQRLAEELLRRHRERGARLTLGSVPAGVPEPGFWKQARNAKCLEGPGLWVHVFDADALSRCAFTDTQRNVLALSRPFLRQGFQDGDITGVRPYRVTDLPQCMALVRKMLAPVTLGFAYTPERLAHQLQYQDVPRTFVLEQDGRVRGLINSHTLEVTGQGSGTFLAEAVDLVAFEDSVSSEDRQRLLSGAMRDMAARGVACALMLRGSSLPSTLMWCSGWLPLPKGPRLTCLLHGRDLELPEAPRVFTHLH